MTQISEIKKPIILNTKYPIIFIGDTHGDWEALMRFVRTNNFRGSIIECGDAGVGFRGWEEKLKILNMLLGEKVCHLYIFRGNHDDPYFFETEYNLSHVHLVSDYRLFQINEEYLLTIGGGISIDRCHRITNDHKAISYGSHQRTYWRDEKFNYDSFLVDDIFSQYNVKYIATHDIGINCFPVGTDAHIVNYYCTFDDQLRKDIIKGRNDIHDMFKQIKSKYQLKEWIYGHFHDSHIDYIDNVKFILLNCDEIYELRF